MRFTPTLAILLTLVAFPSAGGAQQQTPEVRVTDVELTVFTRAHLAISSARDRAHGELGRTHDDQGKRRIREELNAEIASILEEHEIESDRFAAITAAISVDEALRSRFEAMVTALSGGEPGLRP